MIVYRIARTIHINDLTGIGARLYGGWWSKRGIGAIYTSENRSLATVEYLVHTPISYAPEKLSIASIKIPDNIKLKKINISGLPANWRNDPAPEELAEIGTQWVLSNETLALRVPSAVVEHEFNIIINPLHQDMNRVRISNVKEYSLNNRLSR